MNIILCTLMACSWEIGRMVKAIDINSWTLHKKIQRIDRSCDDGEVDIN